MPVVVRNCHDRVMSSNAWASRSFVVRLPIGIAAIVGALLVGGLVGVKLPVGAKPVTVSRGTAFFRNTDNLGTFQANRGGVSALIPGEVEWTDRSSRRESGSVPSCLRRRGEEAVAQASVEAGYTWLRLPDGGSSLIVGWIRCL
ncbi:hypothetical protein SAMN04489717_0160 [Actinopolymorpha singaporensis]|uniref:Uncharacterized protein n=1 Tax=Actinopolymorpha singaporensis TaxID=117157 RepID=A0A1H1L8I7_9ACTN|nr:hypothetical protein SAMN04489717_0160 [Actinopolymorpha singaporensis]